VPGASPGAETRCLLSVNVVLISLFGLDVGFNLFVFLHIFFLLLFLLLSSSSHRLNKSVSRNVSVARAFLIEKAHERVELVIAYVEVASTTQVASKIVDHNTSYTLSINSVVDGTSSQLLVFTHLEGTLVGCLHSSNKLTEGVDGSHSDMLLTIRISV
jgi:hypothetical protein